MNINGLLLTSPKYQLVLKKIYELGEQYYNFRHFTPLYLIKFIEDFGEYKKGEEGILFSCDDNIEFINLLGYGYEGIYEDDDKINEIEEFGKYRCYVEYFNNINIPVEITRLFE